MSWRPKIEWYWCVKIWTLGCMLCCFVDSHRGDQQCWLFSMSDWQQAVNNCDASKYNASMVWRWQWQHRGPYVTDVLMIGWTKTWISGTTPDRCMKGGLHGFIFIRRWIKTWDVLLATYSFSYWMILLDLSGTIVRLDLDIITQDHPVTYSILKTYIRVDAAEKAPDDSWNRGKMALTNDDDNPIKDVKWDGWFV